MTINNYQAQTIYNILYEKLLKHWRESPKKEVVEEINKIYWTKHLNQTLPAPLYKDLKPWGYIADNAAQIKKKLLDEKQAPKIYVLIFSVTPTEIKNEMVREINRELAQKNLRILPTGEITNGLGHSEILAYEEARKNPLGVVRKQIEDAESLLANRKYRESARKAIDATESYAALKLNNKNTLGQNAKELFKHKALQSGVGNIYGWASDTVRHGATTENIEIEESDARFVITLCEALITKLEGNYHG